MQDRYFIGIDLAFSPKNNSGVSVLRGTEPSGAGRIGTGTLEYTGSKLCQTDEDIFAFIQPYLAPGRTVVAVDAPLVVPNKSGMRPCERAVASTYGNRQCAAYPAHQGNMAGTRGPNLLSYLESQGIAVWAGVGVHHGRAAVCFMETYPHAAHLAMFDLPTVWKYKKKPGRTWQFCRREFVQYWRKVWSLMPQVVDGAVSMSDVDPLGQRLSTWLPSIRDDVPPPEVVGKRYKEFEDLTDGLFCAYIAAHIDSGKSALLFSPTSKGLPDLSLYQAGQDFIVVPTK